jgi:hypothetical protein
MAFSATVSWIGVNHKHKTFTINVWLGDELGSREVYVRDLNGLQLRDWVVYVDQHGKFADGREVVLKTSGRRVSHGMLLPPILTSKVGVDVADQVGFIEDVHVRLTREFMALHKDHLMRVVVFPQDSKEFELGVAYDGDEPFSCKLRDDMKRHGIRWIRGWELPDGQALIEKADAWIPDDMERVHVIRPHCHLSSVERTYQGLVAAVHKKMKLMGVDPPFHLNLKVTLDHLPAELIVPVYEPLVA